MAKILIESGADVNLQVQHGNYGSALIAAASSKKSDIGMVELLIKAGADVNMQLQGGKFPTALAAARSRGEGYPWQIEKKKDVIALLIQHGAVD
jgi:ankyrin repeat protein